MISVNGQGRGLLPQILLGVAIGALFVVALYLFNFTQDDAYITFRYAANFEAGQGLVWNIGEHVEGYTNFAWLIALIFFKNLGVGYPLAVKILGPLCSLLLLFVTYRMSSSLMPDGRAGLVSLLPVVIIAANYPFIYWTIGGLETPLFAALTALAFLAYYHRSWLLVPILALAVLTRPEGALVAGFFPLFRLVESRRLPIRELQVVALSFLLVAPYLVFKWSYFGGILPNPFYAKTGWDSAQLSAGVSYVWEFMSSYALFGVVYFVPALFYRKLPETARAMILFAGLYTVYIALVGGDVLKVGRFFLPVLAPLYISFVVAVVAGFERRVYAFGAVALVVALALYLPHETVDAYLKQEQGFSRKVTKLLTRLKAVDESNFSLATPTIGKIGYMLPGHDVYDMVGLTDSTVARHPQEEIEGIETSWRERKYNAEYILQQAPDYILFSTSIKPSSPGERALFLYPAFLRSYVPKGFYFGGRMNDIFKKRSETIDNIQLTIDPQFVQEYVEGVNYWGQGEYRESLKHLQSAAKAGPLPGYSYLYYFVADCFANLGKNDEAFRAYDQAILLDSATYPAHMKFYFALKNVPAYREKARLHRRYLEKLIPWAIPDIDSQANGLR